MPRILSFTSGPEDWAQLLADPEKQWVTGYSARTLAHSWEAADGFPSEVKQTFASVKEPLLAGMTPVFALPEFKVSLPGGTRASQNDIFVLARSNAGPIVIMVEGKVEESFGPTLSSWLVDASPGKKERLKFLLRSLGLKQKLDDSLRYQLFHRLASTVITAEQYRAAAGILLVHSFSQKYASFSDYAKFLDLFQVKARQGEVQRLQADSSIPLFAAWVVGDSRYLNS